MQLRLCCPRGWQDHGGWGCSLRDTVAPGRFGVSWDEASAGTLPCFPLCSPLAFTLVLSSRLRSGMSSARARENEDQNERKTFLQVSEAITAGTRSTIISPTEMRPSFQTKLELILWQCATFTFAYPHLHACSPPEGFSSAHGAELTSMGNKLWNHWDFKHKTKLYTFTSPLIHPHRQTSEQRGEDEWKQ